jgi:hypothetical protein
MNYRTVFGAPILSQVGAPARRRDARRLNRPLAFEARFHSGHDEALDRWTNEGGALGPVVVSPTFAEGRTL